MKTSIFFKILSCSLFFLFYQTTYAADSSTNIISGIHTSNPDFDTLLFNAINSFMWIVGFLAIVALIVGGYKYIISSASESEAESGKKTIIYAVLGIILATLSLFILNFLKTNIKTALFGSAPLIHHAYAALTLKNLLGGSPGTYNDVGDITNNIGYFAPAGSIIAGSPLRIFINYTFVAAFVSILWAAYTYVTAYGDSSKAEKAKKILIFTTIGLVILIGGAAIVNTIVKNNFAI